MFCQQNFDDFNRRIFLNELLQKYRIFSLLNYGEISVKANAL